MWIYLPFYPIISCQSTKILINDNSVSSAEVHREDEESGNNVEPETEKNTKKSVIVTDKLRTVEKIVTATNLMEFLRKGKIFPRNTNKVN